MINSYKSKVISITYKCVTTGLDVLHKLMNDSEGGEDTWSICDKRATRKKKEKLEKGKELFVRNYFM